MRGFLGPLTFVRLCIFFRPLHCKLGKALQILSLPTTFSIISVVMLCLGTCNVLAEGDRSLPKSEALRLIEKVQAAGSNQTFTGTALFETSGAARRMSNISQGSVSGKIKRKVVSMSKRHVVEIYFNNTLEQYFPSKKVVMISKVSRAGFPNMFSGDPSHIINYYDFFRKTELDSLVAKKQTQAYELVPKDRLRWKLRIWIDVDSALPTSVEYMDSDGSVIKREAFTSLNIGTSDIDMDSTIASGKTWRKFFVSRYKNEKESVFYEEPVEGFRLVNCFDSKFHRSGKVSADPDYNQNHCLFSDGVAHVSLVAFYEREPNVYFRVGNWTKGCSSFKSGIVSNRSVISFGCVPKETVQVFFNNSVVR